MSSDTTYDKTSRRMSYLRWRLREGKPLGEAERRELNDYDAKVMGVDRRALDELTFTEPALLQRKKADELRDLCREAGLVASDDSSTKKDLIEIVKVFQQLGLRAAAPTAA